MLGLRRQSGYKNRGLRLTPPESREAGDLWPARMVAHAHFSEASSLVQVLWPDAIPNGAPTHNPSPPHSGFPG